MWWYNPRIVKQRNRFYFLELRWMILCFWKPAGDECRTNTSSVCALAAPPLSSEQSDLDLVGKPDLLHVRGKWYDNKLKPDETGIKASYSCTSFLFELWIFHVMAKPAVDVKERMVVNNRERKRWVNKEDRFEMNQMPLICTVAFDRF